MPHRCCRSRCCKPGVRARGKADYTPLPLAGASVERAQFIANESGIYRLDAEGRESLIVRPHDGEMFVDASLAISPNQAWALIDHIPREAGAGRVEQVRVLVSLRNGTRLEQEAFRKQYGAWLDELADWADNAPSTIELESGKQNQLR